MNAPVDLLTAVEAEAAERRVAGGRVAAGLVGGDRVALALPSSTALLVATLGALRSGVVPVLIDPALTPGERDDLLSDADPALVVDAGALARLLDGPPVELAPAPVARPLHYTSGTTGRPRGVWSGVLGEAEASALLREEVDLWGFSADDVHLVCSPLHHSAPLRFAAGTLLAGGAVAVLPRFGAEPFGAVVRRLRPTTTFVVPAHLQRLFGPGAPSPDLSSFRLVAHAGAPCPEGLKRAALSALPDRTLWEFYGSTEGQFSACSPEEWQERPGTVGRARPGRSLDVDDTGVVWCRPPAQGRFEYWRDPAATAEAWRGDAFTVGDLGRLDGDGYLFLEGRRHDLVITGGVNVRPQEVERALLEVPGVEDAAVFGAPDERWGERLCAAVVVDGVDEAALRAFTAGRLAPTKRPKDFFVVADLPRTANGKVRRRDLPGWCRA